MIKPRTQRGPRPLRSRLPDGRAGARRKDRCFPKCKIFVPGGTKNLHLSVHGSDARFLKSWRLSHESQHTLGQASRLPSECVSAGRRDACQRPALRCRHTRSACANTVLRKPTSNAHAQCRGQNAKSHRAFSDQFAIRNDRQSLRCDGQCEANEDQDANEETWRAVF